MLHYTSLACHLLLISAVSSYHGEYRIRYHKAGPGKYYVIAPESYDQYSTFAVAEYDDPHGLPPIFNFTVRVYDDYENGKAKECFLKCKARWGATKVGVSSLNRLNGNKFVLTWYDELEDHTDLRTRVMLIDVDDNCKRTYIEHSDVAGRVIVVPASQSKFDLFVDDKHTCLGNGDRCRILYNLDSNLLGLRRPFHDKFDWSTVHIERLPNEDLVVRGYLDDTYQMIRVYHDGTSSVLKKFDNTNAAKADLQILSSGTAFCLINATFSENIVNCTVYKKNNEVVFNEIVEFDEPRELIDVRKIHDDELMLVTKKKSCADNEDCWTAYSTLVRDNAKKRENLTLPFRCAGDQKELTVFGAKCDEHFEEVDFYYACRNGDMYNFNVYHIFEKLLEKR